MGDRRKLPECIESTRPEDHDWFVCCTGSGGGSIYLLVSCELCGAMGTVDDPSDEEWNRTTGDPWPWEEPGRVKVVEGNLADFNIADLGGTEGNLRRARELGAHGARRGHRPRSSRVLRPEGRRRRRLVRSG